MASPPEDGPRLVRPIPRRPVQLSLDVSPSPSAPATPAGADQQQQDDEQPLPWRATLPPASAFARLLGAQHQSPFSDGSPTPPPQPSSPGLSRSDSAANLIGSTLYGIYRDVSSTSLIAKAGDVTDTPWGTGAQTPIRPPGLDDNTFELMRKRAGSASRPPLSTIPTQPNAPSSLKAHATPHHQPAGAAAGLAETIVGLFSRLMRVGLLFVLGMGYGILVRHLRDEQSLAVFTYDEPVEGRQVQDGPISPLYIGGWGAMGVLLGVVLPWFDGVWERFLKGGEAAQGGAQEDKAAATDWALVIRGIGAFVGIVFAIRKLPWTSTLQVSAALALTNPFLWYVIDGSKPGFVLSAVVGILGMLVLLQVNPGIMPSPMSHLSPPALQDGHDGRRLNASAAWPSSDGGKTAVSIADAVLMLGGLASEETVVTAIWMMSVLFCSCVCFGNIGRRLAFSRSAVGRGRWAGLR